MNIYVVVDWENASLSAFSSQKQAQKILLEKGLHKFGKNWARRKEEIEEGEYSSLILLELDAPENCSNTHHQ